MNDMIEYFERVAKMAKSDNQSPEMSAIAEIADKAVANPEWTKSHGGNDLDPGVQIQLIVASAKNKSNNLNRIKQLVSNLHLLEAISEKRIQMDDLQNVSGSDYPDFTDSYFQTGYLTSVTEHQGKKIETVRELTEDEMEFLDYECGEWMYDQKHDTLF
jgi:hypothetical protein